MEEGGIAGEECSGRRALAWSRGPHLAVGVGGCGGAGAQQGQGVGRSEGCAGLCKAGGKSGAQSVGGYTSEGCQAGLVSERTGLAQQGKLEA